MTSDSQPAEVLDLDPLQIPRLIIPVNDADGGVNHHMVHSHEKGLVIVLQAYLGMAENDWIKVFWGDDDTPVASDLVLADQVGSDFSMFVAANRIPEGIHALHATVTRSGGGNGGTTRPLSVLVRTRFPGGIDPEPGEPGHQNLAAPEPELPPGGIIDEDAAKNGIKVVIPGYLNMRRYDRIGLYWGGVVVPHEVTQEDMDAGQVEILVSEAVILEAGDSDQLSLIYSVRDEVHNLASDWSMTTYVTVEIGQGLFDAPIIDNPDPDANPWEVIDLDELGDADLQIQVVATSGGDLLVGDVLTLTWVGTTAQDQPITVTPAPQTISRFPSILEFTIANADVRVLGGGRGVASYTVIRDGAPAGASRRSFATFRGAEQSLPAPLLPDASDGVLDPSLADTTVVVPGEALEAGDNLFVTWLGTRANGTPLREEFHRNISGGNAGKPVTLAIDGAALLAPLDGGTLAVSYRLVKFGSGVELESAPTHVRIGEARAELPAPSTRPPAEDGVLDPQDLPLELEIVIAPYPDMADGQTVRLVWKASSGPVHNDFILVSAPIVGREVVFYMERAKVEEYVDARIELSYLVESPGEASRASEIAQFRIGARELPLPIILEADGNEIDPDKVLAGATVHIAANARFKDHDQITLRVTGSSEGGSTVITEEIPAGGAGQPFTLLIPYAVIDANRDDTFELQYEITRATGGQVETSDTVSYLVVVEIGSGPLRIMGARFKVSSWSPWGLPRMISALHDVTLRPVLAQWRYEDEEQWTSATHLNDRKPWLKLYVRSSSETWECRPANIIGNGTGPGAAGHSAFVAIRDEVLGDNGPETDMVAWGHPNYAGELDDRLLELKNVAEVTACGMAYAARLRDGNVACWGQLPNWPPMVYGDFVQVRSGISSFVGRDIYGELFDWGPTAPGIPAPVQEHKDYTTLCSTYYAFAALRASGHVKVWGAPTYGGQLRPELEQMDDLTELANTEGAFAALRDSAGARRVVAWGHAHYGGDVPTEIAYLTNVKSICASNYAFCILLESGEVKSWPANAHDNAVPPDIARLTNIVEVTGTMHAFCVRLSNGRVAAWGYETSGGKITPEVEAKTNIIHVCATRVAFAALCSDGTVVAWGHPDCGGDTSDVAQKLVDVRAIYANANAFTALTADGRVVTWGAAPGGGDSSKVQHLLEGKVTHSRLLSADEAARIADPSLSNANRT